MIDSKYLNKWVIEDITEDDMKDKLYTVSFFMKVPGTNKHCAFGFVEFEDPPEILFTMNIIEDAESDLEIIDQSNRWHPYNHATPSAVHHGMMISVFETDAEAK